MNVVGYKAVADDEKLTGAARFYMNVVGYKAKNGGTPSMAATGFI